MLDKKILDLEILISIQTENNRKFNNILLEKENFYLEKIKILEIKISQSEEIEYNLLIKNKKEKENQILNLKKNLQEFGGKCTEESKNYKILIGDLIQTLEELNNEIFRVKNSREQLLQFKQDENFLDNKKDRIDTVGNLAKSNKKSNLNNSGFQVFEN